MCLQLASQNKIFSGGGGWSCGEGEGVGGEGEGGGGVIVFFYQKRGVKTGLLYTRGSGSCHLSRLSRFMFFRGFFRV